MTTASNPTVSHHNTAEQSIVEARNANSWMWLLVLGMLVVLTLGVTVCWPPEKSDGKSAGTVHASSHRGI